MEALPVLIFWLKSDAKSKGFKVFDNVYDLIEDMMKLKSSSGKGC